MRSLLVALFVAAALVPAAANASIRQNVANDVAAKAGQKFVAKIQGQDCSQFVATMAQLKGNSSSSSSSTASKLKNNAQARTTFVNIVAAPLLNKMIDCNLLPGGM